MDYYMDYYSYDLFLTAKKEKNLETMKEIYLLYPNDLRVKYEYAALLVDNNNDEDAEDLLLELIEKGTEKDKNLSLMLLGKIEIKRNNLDQAKKYYFELSRSKNAIDIVRGIFYLGKIAELEEKYDEAEKYFSMNIDSNFVKEGEKFYSMLELGRVKVFKHDYENARKIFDEIIAMGTEKDKYFALFERAKLSIIEEKYDEAFKEFDEMLLSNNRKDKAHAYHSRGNLYAFLGNYEEAEKNFLKLIKSGVQIDMTHGYRLLILLSIKQNKLEKALDYFLEARRKHVKIYFKDTLYICKNLNIFFKGDYLVLPSYSYVENQILDYDPYLAIESIIDRNNRNGETIFSDDIDVYKLFNEIKYYLVPDYKINNLVSNDRYIIPYYKVGSNGENYLFVETIANTKDILTMYPVFNKKVNLFEEKEEKTRKRI